jgi:hypothetical protein
MSDQFKPQTAADLYSTVPCSCGETRVLLISGHIVVYTQTGAHRRDFCSGRLDSAVPGEPAAKLQPHEAHCDNGACWCWAPGAYMPLPDVHYAPDLDQEEPRCVMRCAELGTHKNCPVCS